MSEKNAPQRALLSVVPMLGLTLASAVLAGCSAIPGATSASESAQSSPDLPQADTIACTKVDDYDAEGVSRIAAEITDETMRLNAKLISLEEGSANAEPMDAVRARCKELGWNTPPEKVLRAEVKKSALVLEVFFSKAKKFPNQDEYESLDVPTIDPSSVVMITFKDDVGMPVSPDTLRAWDYSICAYSKTNGVSVLLTSETLDQTPKTLDMKDCSDVTVDWDPTDAMLILNDDNASSL